MELDPVNWMVSLTGSIFDWILTREWKKIASNAKPLILLGVVGGLVIWGRNLDRDRLADWYRQLGDQEIAEWEAAWAPDVEASAVAGGSKAVDAEAESNPAEINQTAANTPTSGKSDSKPEVSRFAEVLFRRAQTLAPSNRGQWVIAATLAQRGALSQARAMLSKIAPDDREGYPPAHSLLAQLMLDEFRKKPTREMLSQLNHHVATARSWGRVPIDLLRVGSDLAALSGDRNESLKYLTQSAERDPDYYYLLAQRAMQFDNARLRDSAIAKTREHLQQELAQNPKDSKIRLKLAEVYSWTGELEQAEKLLAEGAEIERTAEIARGLSEVARLRYVASKVSNDGMLSANMSLLQRAMQHDPTNPKVAEEVAWLIKSHGQDAPESLKNQLESFLAEGKATTITHALLSEHHLSRQDLRSAIPHLEQVVLREPAGAPYLNNLAFVLAELHPDRLEEAQGYAQRAIAAALASGKPNEDYYDTLATILSKRGMVLEAITAYETAIEINSRRVDFHQRVAAAYRKTGNENMADKHEQVIQRLLASGEAQHDALPIDQPATTPP